MKLEEQQIENVIKAAERAARRYIVTRLPKSEAEDLDIVIEVDTDENLTFNVEINLHTVSENRNYQGLVDSATEVAHSVIRNELDRLARR